MNLSIQTDRGLIRTDGRSVRHALLSFTAPDTVRTASRAALNVSFVIDRSGSMGGSKIELARIAVLQALQLLRDSDRFSVIAYDNEINVVVPSTRATQEAVRNALLQVKGIVARGNTDLAGGWLKGCEQIAEHLAAEQTTRCLLLSDGLANEGITDREQLASYSQELGARGIHTSCLGIGDDYDERLLEAIATASRGQSYHVEEAVQIPDYLKSELGEALETSARDVVVTVQPGSGISVTTLNRYPMTTSDGGTVMLQLGDLVSRQEVSVVFRLVFPAGTVQSTASALFSVTDATSALSMPERDIVWTFADDAQNDAQPRNRVVDRAVARLYAAAARAEALELNRAGQFEEAVKRLHAAASKIASYAGSDAELQGVIEELRQRNVLYSGAMPSASMKKEYSASLSSSRMRDESGKARRRPTS